MTAESVSTAPRAHLALRAWEWMWRSRAIAAAHDRSAEQRYVLSCVERARVAAEVGERTLDPSSPWMAGNAYHLAATAFIESIGWSLRSAAPDQNPPSDSTALVPAARTELSELTAARRDLLLEAADGDAELVGRVVERALGARTDVYSLTSAESELAAREVARVARGLLRRSAESTQDTLDQLYFQRLVRTVAGLLLLLTGVAAALALRAELERRADLTRGKPWSTSSVYEVVCTSPSHDCEAKKSYFFHTREEPEPWLELDLERAESFSRVRVINRRDCCEERALPLIVEVSPNRATWREVSRRSEPFEEWEAEFAPVRARYVRLRVGRASILHLEEARVLR